MSTGALASLQSIWRNLTQEHCAFVVTCIYLIFEYNRPQLVYPALNFIPWGKTLLVAAITLAFFDRSARRPPAGVVVPLTIFTVCVLVSKAYAQSPPGEDFQWMVFFNWPVVVLLFSSIVSTRSRLALFMAFFFLCNLKMAQHGFTTWARRGFGSASWGVSGSPGWFDNSGEFGMEMAVFLPMVVAYLAHFRRQWSWSTQAFFWLAAIVVTGTIIACNSRGGVLGLAVVGLWGLAYSRQRFKALISVVVVAVIVYQAIPPEFKARFETAGRDNTSLSRLNYWRAGMEAIRENPVIGIGFGHWKGWVKENHPELMRTIGEIKEVELIHNTYMQAATELGLVGAAAYFGILLQIFITNRQSAKLARMRNDPFLEATASGLTGYLLVFTVPSYFMSILYYPYIWVLMALTQALATVCRTAPPAEAGCGNDSRGIVPRRQP